MEDIPQIKEINFLPNPKINPKKLEYISNTKKVYANLYEIFLTKPIKLYQYPFKAEPEIEAGDSKIRKNIYKFSYKKLKSIYGECLISGDSLFGTKKVEEIKNVEAVVYSNGRKEFKLIFDKCAKERTIKQDDVNKDPLTKQFLELIISDILHSNPNLEFYKDIFVLTDHKENIDIDDVNVNFYPGFTTSFMETDKGNYLNVTLKNKIIQNYSVLDYLNYYYEGYKTNKDIQKQVNDDLRNRPFKVSYMKRNYKIDEIIFDQSPLTHNINYEGKTRNLIEYYKMSHDIKKIKDPNQPLIVVHKKGPQGSPQSSFFIPELCFLSGLEESETKKGGFMKELAYYTKLKPNDRVNKTNEFISLLDDDRTDEAHPISSKKKKEYYGIEVKPTANLFDAYYMKETKLLGGKVNGKNMVVKSNDRTFPVLEKKPMTNWVCLYEKKNYDDADNLYNTMLKASKAYGFKLGDPEWKEIPNNSEANTWIKAAEEFFPKDEESNYDFVVFLLGQKEDKLYPKLKKHSICKNGYISQVVKVRSIKKKGAMSVCSKILLQINAKLGGISYKISLDKVIKDRNLMVIGVDSSHIKGMRTGVAMVATVNDSFTDFYNKEEIIKEENKAQLKFCVSSFIEEAVEEFKKQKINKGEKPKGIIIYRQGVSLQQKIYLKDEIVQIDECCKAKGILYYYILVNTKTTFKFFEKTNNGYINPQSGLLIMDGITNKNYFEFYIQPQQVTEGSATPTCFHVAYGNLDFPEMIPKFTYDLCHIYSNWQGTVRIPNIIKAAEKLAKITAKYTLEELSDNLKSGQAYL